MQCVLLIICFRNCIVCCLEIQIYACRSTSARSVPFSVVAAAILRCVSSLIFVKNSASSFQKIFPICPFNGSLTARAHRCMASFCLFRNRFLVLFYISSQMASILSKKGSGICLTFFAFPHIYSKL